MSEHVAHVRWRKKPGAFTYESYDRTHEIRFEGGTIVRGSSAPEFLGSKELVNPEEMLAASLSTCHMLTFLAVAARMRLTVESYEDTATATLAKDGEGKMCVTQVVLKPKITFSGEIPDADKITKMHEKSHHNCFIANSVKCKVSVDPLN